MVEGIHFVKSFRIPTISGGNDSLAVFFERLPCCTLPWSLEFPNRYIVYVLTDAYLNEVVGQIPFFDSVDLK